MKIDKDIPIPKSKKGFILKNKELYENIGKMEIGDSFLAPENVMKNGYLGNTQYLERKFKVKLAQRKTAEGVRVWRIA
jgi:hypothetical protein